MENRYLYFMLINKISNNGEAIYVLCINCRVITTNSQEHVVFVVKHSDTFAPAGGNDFFKAVTHDSNDEAFGSVWEEIQDPQPAASLGDFTTAGSIPEFPTLLMPVLSVILIVGMNYRKRRNELASRV